MKHILGLGLSLGQAAEGGASAAPGLDTDAQTIIDAVEAADGQALETTVRDAINAFVVGCKSDNIWTPLSSGVFRLLAGPRTLAGIHKCGIGVDPSNFEFVIGDYIRTSGLQGDGSSKYLDSNRSSNTDDQDNQCLAVSRSGTETGGVMIGAGGGSTGASSLSTMATRSRSATISMITLTSTFIGISRSSGTGYARRANGSTATVTQTSETPTTLNYFVFANNADGAPAGHSNARVNFYVSCPDLPIGGLASLEARVATYMSAIAGI